MIYPQYVVRFYRPDDSVLIHQPCGTYEEANEVQRVLALAYAHEGVTVAAWVIESVNDEVLP